MEVAIADLQAAENKGTDMAMRDRVARAGRSAQRGVESLMADQPLVMGAIAVAIGAAIGGALPRSRTEDRLVGAYSDRLYRQAKGAAGAVADEAREMAGEAVEEAKDKASEAADRVERKAPSASEMAEEAKDKAREAGERLRDAAESGARESGHGPKATS
mgnify:CR=1 FL=1